MVGTTNVSQFGAKQLSLMIYQNFYQKMLYIEYSEEDEFLDDDSSCDEEDSEDEIESDIFE